MSEPFTAYNFRVEITLPGAGEPLCEAAFAECDGIEMRFDVKTLREAGDSGGGHLLAGPASYGHVTLRRGMTSSFDLWDWCASVLRDPGVRADARVVMLSSDGAAEHARFLLRRCLPVRLKAPPLDAVHGVVAVEELELACESLTLERPGGASPDPPRVQKAELRELDERFSKEVNKDRWVEVQVNPRDLRRSRVNPGGEARLALELWFDAAGKDDVRRLTERVAYFATPRPADSKAPGPRRCGSRGGSSGSTAASRRSRRGSTSSRPTADRGAPGSRCRCSAREVRVGGAQAHAHMATKTAPSPTVAGLVERPRLFALLDRGASAPVTLICASAGSGKTMLVSSWLRSARPSEPVAWVDVDRDETDATRFWTTVMDALRGSGAIAPDDPLATLVPAPTGGQEEFLERLRDGLGRLSRPVLLILDDLHQLRSEQALQGLERLFARAPEQLRTLVVSRRDPKLGLHRLRLAGELVEIRGPDLDFTAEEAGALMSAAGVAVAPGDVGRLHQRTEGWAAGLRLAAMSLARHAAPDRFVAEFSGSERTVADYLLGEVLASQPPELRSLLLRTCILERVNGPLADLLTGRSDGTRLLHELEEANALVVAVDVARSWFRYHHLLADLLRLELRREAPEEVLRLHRLAAGWHAEQGHAVEAIRHAQLGADWELAGELLGRHWVHLLLDGEEATLASLLAGLPPERVADDAELATIAAADMLEESRWAEADRLIAAAQRSLAELPAGRRHRAETALATVQLLRARRVGELESVVDEAGALLHGEGAPAGLELEAFALMNLGIAESWTLRLAESEAHLEQALALGRRLGRPYVEIGCLTSLGTVANLTRRVDLAERRVREAIAIAERLGWSTLPIVGVADLNLAALLIDRGRFEEGDDWLRRAQPILTGAAEAAANVGLHHVEGMLAMARGRFADALAAFREGGRVAQRLRAQHFLAGVLRHWELRAQIRLGDLEPARAALAEADDAAFWCGLEAHLRLAEGDGAGAAAAVAPVLAGTAFAFHPNQEIEALLLDAVARSRMGEREAAERSVERALDLSEPNGHAWIVHTVPGTRELLAAHPAHRTAHAAHLRALRDQLEGAGPVRELPQALTDPLNERELTVLRFLPTNLSATDIGHELFLSVNTVKTHMRKLYAKLDVHTRAEAVERGRALGLLAPSRRG